jgi:cytochrome c553
LVGALALRAAIAAGGDPEAGRRKTVTCKGCHGQESMQSVPKLGGQSAAYFVAAMRAYQDGLRAHPTMRDVAKAYSDRELKDFAAYYAQLGATDEGETHAASTPPSSPVCETCHGRGGQSPSTADTPVLAGQKASYLRLTLAEYRDGARKHAVMQSQAAALSDAEIESLSNYFAGTKRLVSQ